MEIRVMTADAVEVDPAVIGRAIADLGYYVRLVDVNDGARTWEPGDDHAPPVAVREHIRHGSYRFEKTVTAPTLTEAVNAVMDASPYHFNVGEPGRDRVIEQLHNTGHADLGWATYDVVPAPEGK